MTEVLEGVVVTGALVLSAANQRATFGSHTRIAQVAGADLWEAAGTGSGQRQRAGQSTKPGPPVGGWPTRGRDVRRVRHSDRAQPRNALVVAVVVVLGSSS